MCVYVCTYVFMFVRGGEPLHCRHCSSSKHPLVSHMLPSLLIAGVGSAASTKHGVVDTVPYGVFLLHNSLSQFCQPNIKQSLHKYACDCVYMHIELCISLNAHLCVKVCVLWSSLMVFVEILSKALDLFFLLVVYRLALSCQFIM